MSKSRNQHRRSRRSSGCRIRVFSEINRELQPERIAHIITSAELEQAQLEAAAQSEDTPRVNREQSRDSQENDHA